MGYQAPHSGQAYAGMGLYYTLNGRRQREMIATRLATPMEKDSFYTVSFFISPTARTTSYGPAIAVHELGANFSDTMPHITSPYSLDLRYDIVNDTARKLIDTTQWYEISGGYKARGGEQWMTIGSFGPNVPAYSAIGPANTTSFTSYIYLDDVSVVKTQPEKRTYRVTICTNPREGAKLVSSHTTGTWQWSTGQLSHSIIADHAGLYTCWALNDTNWVEEVFEVVDRKVPLPHIPDTSICAGIFNPQLAPGDTSLIWYEGANDTSGNTVQPPINTSYFGKSTLWVARVEGTCISDKKELTVTFIQGLDSHPLQTADRCLEGPMTTVSIGNAVTAATRFRWTLGDTVCCISTDRDGMHIRTASDYCKTVNDTFIVRSSPCKSCAIFPNVFTPNGDSRNDEFRWFLYCPIKDFHMSVYNRWGQRIFQTDDQTEYWNGGDAVMGTYMYMATFTHRITGYTFVEKGEVILMR
jgi:gliding motility-associated-like protein